MKEFFEKILELKTVPRQGWINKGVEVNPESVADHCFSVAAIAMIISECRELDTQKILKLSIIHDLAESVIGDITPDEMEKEQKNKMEDSAIKKIFQNLPDKISEQFLQLWSEYKDKTTKESILVHQIDKFEMFLQAKKYEKNGVDKEKVKPFMDSAQKMITDEKLSELMKVY